ncbi:flagellar biosynthetic protein FliZ precursor [Neobacillus bataviensis LMG 21833]|uniref:Flagellar biosynthetic protein FliZ n=1 Tax=Neobacillus bataviensis LMG 21833 TaxID=1117379 RepID=K6D5V7_9BACI|nr:flagellar biosynthetic protein FliO [Neobacillus bataviensis]EKN63679.1 flagellar biosynthetic protein FliZ precursor [Neobacillus bataviensis LMG 21833]
MIHVRKKVTLALIIILLFPFFQHHHVAFAKGNNTVYDAYQQDKGQSGTDANPSVGETSSLVPLAAKFIFSFAAIIMLLLLFLKFLKAKSKQISSQSPVYSMGGHSLGGNRSLQLMMIGKTLYILGIGNDVQLLRTIEPGEEQDAILQSLVEETERKQRPAFFPFKKKQTADFEETFLAQMNQVQQSSIPIHKLKD